MTGSEHVMFSPLDKPGFIVCAYEVDDGKVRLIASRKMLHSEIGTSYGQSVHMEIKAMLTEPIFAQAETYGEAFEAIAQNWQQAGGLENWVRIVT